MVKGETRATGYRKDSRFTERVVAWGFSLMLSGLLLFVVMVVGAMVDIFIHPLAAIPVFVAGGIFVASYFNEMVRKG